MCFFRRATGLRPPIATMDRVENRLMRWKHECESVMCEYIPRVGSKPTTLRGAVGCFITYGRCFQPPYPEPRGHSAPIAGRFRGVFLWNVDTVHRIQRAAGQHGSLALSTSWSLAPSRSQITKCKQRRYANNMFTRDRVSQVPGAASVHWICRLSP